MAKAQRRDTGELYYIATMKPVDGEDDERIERHRRERDGWGFTTIEQQTDIENLLQKCDKGGSFLLDSVTALLFNEMNLEKTIKGLSALIENIGSIVIVSDYIYSDAMVYDDYTENYRKDLAKLDCFAAKHCDVVLEIAYSGMIVHKGGEGFKVLYDKML